MTFDNILNVISSPTQLIEVKMMRYGVGFLADDTAEYFLQVSNNGLGERRVVGMRVRDNKTLVVELE